MIMNRGAAPAKHSVYMSALKSINLAFAFFLELCLLAALAYWGFQTGRGLLLQVALGIGAPLIAAVIWGICLAPRALIKLSAPLQGVLKLVLFGLAAAGLATAGQPLLGAILVLAFIINWTLAYIWNQ